MINSNSKRCQYVQIDKYVFDQLRPLGQVRGACGIVYLGFLAHDMKEADTVVAIKEIPVKGNHDITDSLLQEVNVLRKLKHHNIVTFIDSKMNDESMYLITQFCNQGTIEDLMQQKQLSEREVLWYFSQIAEGFKYIRHKKIVHRDVKPQNILIHDGVVKIADFGLAKVVDPNSQNRFQTFSGTPLFMSPQIVKQEAYTEVADIWSLGVTLYFMLFRQYPWNEANPLKLLKRIEQKVQQLVPEGATISEAALDLLQRMLMIEEKDRITWEELFTHKAINQLGGDFSTLSTEVVEDLTVKSFLTEQCRKSDDIQEFGRRQTMVYEHQCKSLVGARSARDHLEFERQNGLFLIKVANELESQKKMDPEIPDDLYAKCMFLLFKRIYALFLNLNQMIMFETNSSGIIEIDEGDWQDLMRSQQLSQELNQMREKIQWNYDFARKEFAKVKDLLYNAQLNLINFSSIERGDAYKDNLIEENENLILATNDNFIRLFLLLAQKLQPIYFQALEDQKSLSFHQIVTEYKIDFIFVYDLIIVLTFRNILKKPSNESNLPLNNFQKYYEDRKRIDPIEILYRIHKQKLAWLHLIK